MKRKLTIRTTEGGWSFENISEMIISRVEDSIITFTYKINDTEHSLGVNEKNFIIYFYA